MHFNFNNHGFIEPINKIVVPFDFIELYFVKKYSEESSRHKIYRSFLSYLDKFQEEISTEFEVFINGSFVTTKSQPNDIDFVIFLNSEAYDSHESLIENKFDRDGAFAVFGNEIQAFIVRKDIKGNSGYEAYKEAYAYWWQQFEKTKRVVRGIKQKKGFIEVIFTNRLIM